MFSYSLLVSLPSFACEPPYSLPVGFPISCVNSPSLFHLQVLLFPLFVPLATFHLFVPQFSLFEVTVRLTDVKIQLLTNRYFLCYFPLPFASLTSPGLFFFFGGGGVGSVISPGLFSLCYFPWPFYAFCERLFT